MPPFVENVRPRVRKDRSSDSDTSHRALTYQKNFHEKGGDTQSGVEAPPPCIDVDQEPPVERVQGGAVNHPSTGRSVDGSPPAYMSEEEGGERSIPPTPSPTGVMIFRPKACP